MPDSPITPDSHIRIWQQNLNRSGTTQHSLLHSPHAKDWDIYALQEPHVRPNKNTISSPKFYTVYPSTRYSSPETTTRAVTLISTSISTNSWKQIPFPSPDVVVVQFTGPSTRLTLINVYNDCTKQDTEDALARFLASEAEAVQPSPDDHVVWLGDFNRHHPLWDDDANSQLFSREALSRAQPLIDLLEEHDMVMALPKGVPTLQLLNSKNWTRPDNVFCTEQTLDLFIRCETDPSNRGPKTDHVPILSVLDLATMRAAPEPRRNFRNTDWEDFNRALQTRLHALGPPTVLATVEEFQTATRNLTHVIQETIDDKVPICRPSPYAKRWWNSELSALRSGLSRLSREAYKHRHHPHHPTHEKLRQARNHYSEAIKKTKAKHWMDWLESIEGDDIWMANKYISSDPGDGGCAKIPTLHSTTNDGPAQLSTNEDKSRALAETFFPPPPRSPSIPSDPDYPTPLSTPSQITEENICNNIARLSPFKAPGPDGISNSVFIHCRDALVPYLLPIFRAVFTLRTYYDPWKEFTTVVLRKPGRSNYALTKSYRPIALLNTTCKLLTAIVTEQLSHIVESNNLLPPMHFGGRPKRSTTDSLHLLTSTVKNAWRSGQVASALFLDIEGAFPNAVTDRLLHNMRKRKIPTALVLFVDRLLRNRRTKLKFDGYTSDWIPINNGIGQGDPLSMLLYVIYSSDLAEIPATNNKRELALAFVDDTVIITIGKTFTETHDRLRNLMERENGAFDWSEKHNSKFELSKFALIDFHAKSSAARPPMKLRNTTITPARVHKFLGVVVDQSLRWNAHAAHALSKGTAYVLQIKRISSANKGLPATMLRRLYLAVAVPKMLYAIDVWCTPPYTHDLPSRTRGSIGTIRKISRVQRQALLAITGAYRTTATDVLEIYANVLPLELRIQNLCHQAAIRLASHPSSHPLQPLVRRAAARTVKRHKSPLHHIMQAFNITPDSTEKLDPADLNPNSVSPYSTAIPPTKEEAQAAHDAVSDPIRVYCDGSSTAEGVGAAAVMLHTGRPPRLLRYHLGPPDTHTVYEAEAVGLTLAAHLLATEPELEFPISIFADNRAVIQSGERLLTKSGHHIIRRFHRSIKTLKKSTPARQWKLTLQWIPGHEGIPGNEEADVEAKTAAEGAHKNSHVKHLPPYLRKSSLPRSVSAAIRAQREASKRRWSSAWQDSPRHTLASKFHANLPSHAHANHLLKLPKQQTTMYIRLRTGHIGLNQHLHRIKKASSPKCRCGAPRETVAHYLTVCPCHNRARHILHTHLGRKASQVSYLLSHPDARPHLFRFIKTTKRFCPPPHAP